MSNELIRNCKFRFQCNKAWQDLDTTSSENIRVCRACGEQVHLCVSDDELRGAMEANHCVAIRIEIDCLAAEHSQSGQFSHDDKYDFYDKNAAVDLLLEQDPSDQEFCDDEDDTDLEFEAVNPVPAQNNRDDEDDTDLEFETIDPVTRQGSMNRDYRDDEDDTDLKFENIEREDRPISADVGGNRD